MSAKDSPNQYATLDSLILTAIIERRRPLYDKSCAAEAARIAEATGRKDYRVIDGRLQALRKAGRIVHKTKHSSNGHSGWYPA